MKYFLSSKSAYIRMISEGSCMEARFRHWIKNVKVIDINSQLWDINSQIWEIKSELRVWPSLGVLGPVHWICYGLLKITFSGVWGGYMSCNRNMSNNVWSETRQNRTETIAVTEFTTNATNLKMHFCHIEKSHPHVVPNDFLLLNTEYNFVEWYQTTLVTLDFYCMDKNSWISQTMFLCSCGSVVEHCVSSAKVVGSIPREHMYWQKKNV